jgi:hypothetical protein
MSDLDPKLPHVGAESEPLFSAELRATLRRELGPGPGHRTRVREGLRSSVAAGTLTPAAQRVEALMHGHAASVAGAKAGATAVLHSVSAKLVVLGLVVASGSTAIVLRGPSEQTRTAPEAPAARSGNDISPPPAAPWLAAPPAEPDLQIAAALPLQADGAAPAATAAAASSARAVEPPARATAPLIATGKRSREAIVRKHTHPKPAQPEPAPSPPALTAPPSPAEGATQTPAPAESGAAAQTSAAVPKHTPAPTTQTQQAASPQLEVAKHQLAAELALVRTASDALQRGDADTTLVTLQAYVTQFPRGALRVEADALRAIALCASDAATAAAASVKFLKAHASSTLAERVRRACQKR